MCIRDRERTAGSLTLSPVLLTATLFVRTQQHIDHRGDDADDHCTGYRPEETVDDEVVAHEPVQDLQHEAVHHQRKKTQGKERDRKCEDSEYGADKSVQHHQKKGRYQSRLYGSDCDFW